MKHEAWKSTGNCVLRDMVSCRVVEEVMPDHIHLFSSVPPAQAVATAVKLIKGASARMLFTRFLQVKKRLWGGHLWNPSYYVGTAGHVSSQTIERYIERQKEASEER